MARKCQAVALWRPGHTCNPATSGIELSKELAKCIRQVPKDSVGIRCVHLVNESAENPALEIARASDDDLVVWMPVYTQTVLLCFFIICSPTSHFLPRSGRPERPLSQTLSQIWSHRAPLAVCRGAVDAQDANSASSHPFVIVGPYKCIPVMRARNDFVRCCRPVDR